MRRRICAGNWKMFKTTEQSAAYLQRFLAIAHTVPESVELVVCPPFTALQTASELLHMQQRVKLGAQNMHWESSGAFTGEISPPMLLDLGAQYVIVGHSERRQYFGETDEMVRRKVAAALANDLIPILAVGESLAIRQAGGTQRHVVGQVRAALDALTREQLRRIVVAYEPIWAIGTGENCDPHEANAVMHEIRICVEGLEQAPILYGGSVKAQNVAQYTAQPEIDGGLVGGASLDADDFAALATAAA